MKEIGGYFELDLTQKKEYHENVIKLNSARNGIEYILRAQNITKVYIPNYICNSVIEPLQKLCVTFEFYNIDENFEIVQDIYLVENEKLFYVNYFGLKNRYINNLYLKYGDKLILDNTHAFYDFPQCDLDTLYSPRKFFGVSDGGYLYTKHFLEGDLEYDSSCEYILQLAGRIDKSASSFYRDYQKAEQRLINQPIKIMSKFTSKVLNSIDYDEIKFKRERNFFFLHSKLQTVNKLNLDITTISVPFAYPLMTDDTDLRDKLIESKIYVPRYWNEVLGRSEVSKVEKDFVNKIIPLPVDQRCNLDDLKKIVTTIKKGL